MRVGGQCPHLLSRQAAAREGGGGWLKHQSILPNLFCAAQGKKKQELADLKAAHKLVAEEAEKAKEAAGQ